MNAPIRLSFALAALLLAGCAGSSRASWADARSYRETLVVEQPTLRSAEQTTTLLQRAHERARSAHDRTFVVTTVR